MLDGTPLVGLLWRAIRSWRVLHEKYRLSGPAPTWGPDPMRRTALLSQVLAVNTLLVVVTVFAVSLVARVDLSDAVSSRQFLVLVAAILATLLANNLVMRRRFAPLESLTRTMEAVGIRLSREIIPNQSR